MESTSYFLRTWALLMTASTLVLTGVLVGVLASQPSKQSAALSVSSSGLGLTPNETPSSQSSDPRFSEPANASVYSVPKHLQAIDQQWRTTLTLSPDGYPTGYAALFDPQRREVIVEHCRHSGYFDEQSQRPTPFNEFCTGVLWAELLQFTDHGAQLRQRDGTIVELALKLVGNADEPRLELAFNEHRMSLLVGSKNDLLQAMEATEIITQQRQQMMSFNMDQRAQALSRTVSPVPHEN